jgi:hypothetical protein
LQCQPLFVAKIFEKWALLPPLCLLFTILTCAKKQFAGRNHWLSQTSSPERLCSVFKKMNTHAQKEVEMITKKNHVPR